MQLAEFIDRLAYLGGLLQELQDPSGFRLHVRFLLKEINVVSGNELIDPGSVLNPPEFDMLDHVRFADHAGKRRRRLPLAQVVFPPNAVFQASLRNAIDLLFSIRNSVFTTEDRDVCLNIGMRLCKSASEMSSADPERSSWRRTGDEPQVAQMDNSTVITLLNLSEVKILKALPVGLKLTRSQLAAHTNLNFTKVKRLARGLCSKGLLDDQNGRGGVNITPVGLQALAIAQRQKKRSEK